MSENGNSSSQWMPIKATKTSMRITNPIRDTLDTIQFPKDHPKRLISLSIGVFIVILFVDYHH